MPTFKPPWGPKKPEDQVTSRAHHLGYHYMVAYLMDAPAPASYIRRACEEAHEAGAPKDAVCSTDTGWKRRGELNMMLGRRLDDYVRALRKYEDELDAEGAGT
jgi:hypothetical protein